MNRKTVFPIPRKKLEELSSREIAKDRLEMLLLSDRMKSTPEMVAQMKREIQEVVEKYLNLDCARISIQIDLTSEIKQGVDHVKTIQIKKL